MSEPVLINRGDGVAGHYCIGRQKHGLIYEFWSDREGWCSAGTVYTKRRSNCTGAGTRNECAAEQSGESVETVFVSV